MTWAFRGLTATALALVLVGLLPSSASAAPTDHTAPTVATCEVQVVSQTSTSHQPRLRCDVTGSPASGRTFTELQINSNGYAYYAPLQSAPDPGYVWPDGGCTSGGPWSVYWVSPTQLEGGYCGFGGFGSSTSIPYLAIKDSAGALHLPTYTQDNTKVPSFPLTPTTTTTTTPTTTVAPTTTTSTPPSTTTTTAAPVESSTGGAVDQLTGDDLVAILALVGLAVGASAGGLLLGERPGSRQ